MKFDDVLLAVGEFGLCQKRLLLLISVTGGSVVIMNLSPVFTMKVPKYRCKIPGYANDTYDIHDVHHAWLVNQTIPIPIPITMYDVTVYDDGTSHANGSQRNCDEWVYDKSIFRKTLASKISSVQSMSPDMTCANVKCPPDLTCEERYGEPTCVKPGTCPKPPLRGVCAEMCTSDISCPRDTKCCSNGCGHSCRGPVVTVALTCASMKCSSGLSCVERNGMPTCVKPGTCPKPTSDSRCLRDQKCCSVSPAVTVARTCVSMKCSSGFVCVEENGGPICAIVKPGTCRKESSQGSRGTCAETCRSDSDCYTTMKCCSNGCGRECRSPALAVALTAFVAVDTIRPA